MKDTVLEAIEEDMIDDRILASLIEVTIASDNGRRPLFINPLDEPLFYRQHFLPWVREGLNVRREIERASELTL